MSAKIMGLVWEIELPYNEQIVMLALADHADHAGEHAYPGIDFIAWKTGYQERQVQRILNTLEAKGLIESVHGKKGGRGRPTEYTIHLEKGDKKSPFVRKGDKKSPIPNENHDNMSPFSASNSDNMSPFTEERVTFTHIKGDISDNSNGHRAAPDIAPSTPNRPRTTTSTEDEGDTVPQRDTPSAASPLVKETRVAAKLDDPELADVVERYAPLLVAAGKSIVFEARMWRKKKPAGTINNFVNWLEYAIKPDSRASPPTSTLAPSTTQRHYALATGPKRPTHKETGS